MTLEERVSRLERQNRWLKVLASTAALGLLLVAVMAADPVRTNNRFQVTDGQGRVRIDAEAHPDFGPLISLYDNTGTERLRIGSDQNANGKPFIWFFDDEFQRVKTIEP